MERGEDGLHFDHQQVLESSSAIGNIMIDMWKIRHTVHMNSIRFFLQRLTTNTSQLVNRF